MDQGIGIRRHSGTLLRVGNLSGHSIEIRVYWAQCLPNAPGQFQVLLLQLDRATSTKFRCISWLSSVLMSMLEHDLINVISTSVPVIIAAPLAI